MKNKAYLSCMAREEAQKKWLEKLTASGYFNNLPIETLSVGEALGRITAGNLHAFRSVPHYNSAAMDGIAVWAADTFGAGDRAPKTLQVLAPGQPFDSGCCYMVNTGNRMPAGTDAVIMVEHVHFADGTAEILAPATPWQHVRIIGEDIVQHEIVVPEMEEVTPSAVGALLAAGIEMVPVVARPVVHVIPTGNELVATQQELMPGKILDVNSHMLAAAATQLGGLAVRHDIVRDDYEAIKSAIIDGLEQADMVLINAGTSAGTEDYTYKVLSELGEVLVHGVATKPGKPVILAICQGKPVIGIPGYPVSAMLVFDLFAKQVILQRGRKGNTQSRTVKASLARQLPSEVGVEEYLRVSLGTVQNRRIVVPLSRGAGLISSLTRAHGIIKVDQGSAGLSAGENINVTLINNRLAEQDNLLAIGSHDLALDILGVYLRRKGNLSLSCANVGSMGGVMAIRNGEAHLAGVHILDEKTGTYNIHIVRKYLSGMKWKLIHLGMREQGIMVKKGNPKGIKEIRDLAQDGISFVNRQRGAGTRMLLDYELKKLGIASSQITGYEKEVGTHMAVAATILAGAADAGLGIRAAAKIMDLDFIPIAQEQYDLIVALEEQNEIVAMLMEILQSSPFRQEVEAMGGYDLSNSGKMMAQGDGT